jgi:hypothetical protein
VRDHVGWFPLHPRDRHIPWWERRGLRRDSQHITYFNRNYVTVVNHHNFISARPVHRHIVHDSVILREARAARFSSGTLPIPNRSSLRLASETGGRHRQSPSANILNRAAVVRTAPAAPPRTFQEKLPEIQRNQGRPIEPSSMLVASHDHRASAHRPRIRAAAEEIRGRDFAPRNPGATSGPVPQPVTAARGKKLAIHETSVGTERAERAEKLNIPQQPAPQPNQGVAGKPASPTTEQERDRQRQEKQTVERKRQAQQQQELDRKKQDQRNEEQRKAQLQKHQQDQRRQEPSPQERPSREQQRLEELERRQAQQREVERKAELQQSRQEQERREQLRQQQQLQERQTQQQRQQEQERKTQLQQQDRVQREQLRQQQSQQRQAHEQLQREQERNAQIQQRQEQLRAQQFRQQQLQEREAQQVQRQQQQDRRQQLRQQQLQERQLPQLPRQPGQPQRPGL